MRIARTALLATFCLAPVALAQRQVSANFLISKVPSNAPTGNWETTDGRGTVATSVNGVTLRGYLYEGRNPKAPTILFFNGENVLLNDSDALCRSLAALGPTVLVYDYRGLGFSTGKPSVALSREDAVLLYDQAEQSLRPGHPIVVYGFSMGADIAAYVATRRPVAALILAAPMASAAEELRIYSGILGNPLTDTVPSPEAIEVLDGPALVAQSQAPLLVIHSPSDIMVPFAQGKAVFDASSVPGKKMLELPSVPHGETPARPESLRAVKTFLESVPNALK